MTCSSLKVGPFSQNCRLIIHLYQPIAAPWPTIIKLLFDSGTFVTLAAGPLGPGVYLLRALTGEHGGMGIGTYDISVIPSNTWLGNWTSGKETGPIRYHAVDPTNQLRFGLLAFINLTTWSPEALDTAAMESPREVADCWPLPGGGGNHHHQIREQPSSSNPV